MTLDELIEALEMARDLYNAGDYTVYSDSGPDARHLRGCVVEARYGSVSLRYEGDEED